MPFFTAAILLCAVRDAQCRTSECSRARKKCRAVVPGTSRFSCWARKLPSWKQEVTLGKTMWELLAHRTSMDISMGHASWNIQIFFQSSPVCSWAGLAKTTRGYVAWYLEFKVADSSVVSWVNPCKGGFWTCLAVGIIWKVSTYLHLIIDNDLLTMLTMFTFNLMVWWYNLSSAAGVTFVGFKSRP